MEEGKLVASSGSYVRLLLNDPPHQELITLALAHTIAVRFRHRERGEEIVVSTNGNIHVGGRYNNGPIQMSFYGEGLGVCDLSNRPRRENWPLRLVGNILQTLFEEELVFGQCGMSLGRGRILELGGEDEKRAACLVYAAILKRTNKKVAKRVARSLIPFFPVMRNLIGLYPPRLMVFYHRAIIRE